MSDDPWDGAPEPCARCGNLPAWCECGEARVTMSDVIQRDRDTGSHFFDPVHVGFWGSRLLPDSLVEVAPDTFAYVTVERVWGTTAHTYTMRQVKFTGSASEHTVLGKRDTYDAALAHLFGLA